jgi:cell division protein FtsI/penicillin-binding protein 2
MRRVRQARTVRILFVAIGLVPWMLVIGGRLVNCKVHRQVKLALRARNQQLSSIETAPTRGQVLDRQGRELARSLDTESFYSDPSEVKDVEGNGRKISSITGLDRAELVKEIQRRPGREQEISSG